MKTIEDYINKKTKEYLNSDEAVDTALGQIYKHQKKWERNKNRLLLNAFLLGTLFGIVVTYLTLHA